MPALKTDKNKIIRYSSRGNIKFLNAAIKGNEKLEVDIHKIVNKLYSDIIKTGNNRNKFFLEQFEEELNDIVQISLRCQTGIVGVFNKIKGEIEEISEKNKITEEQKKEITKLIKEKLLEKYENKREQENGKEGTENTRNLIKNILNDDKYIESFRKNILGTIKKTNFHARKNAIDLLTHNRYNELFRQIKTEDKKANGNTDLGITKIDNKAQLRKQKTLFNQFMEKGVKATFHDHINKLKVNLKRRGIAAILKKERQTKNKRLKSFLKFFELKRTRLENRGFLGLYNKCVYKKLIDRIDEFNQATINDSDIRKNLKMAVFKYVGKSILGFMRFGINMVTGIVKGAFNTMLNVSRKLAKLGMTILSNVKQFIFTPQGMWFVGFVSGIIYQALVKPILKWVGDILSPVRDWLGLSEKSSFEDIKTALGVKEREKWIDLLEDRNLMSGLRALPDITRKLEETQLKLNEIETFMNGGYNSVIGKTLGHTVGFVSALTAGAFAAKPLLGMTIGFIGGAASAFIQHYFDTIPLEKEQNIMQLSLISRMRREWEGKPLDDSKSKLRESIFQVRKAKNQKKSGLQEELDKINEQLKNNPTDENLKEKRKQLMERISDIEYELWNLGVLDGSGEQDDIDRAVKLMEILEKEKFLFNLTSLNVDTFWKNAQKDVFMKTEPQNEKQSALAELKRMSVLQAIQDVAQGVIKYMDIGKVANQYLNRMLESQRDFVIDQTREKESPGGQILYEKVRVKGRRTDEQLLDFFSHKKSSLKDMFNEAVRNGTNTYYGIAEDQAKSWFNDGNVFTEEEKVKMGGDYDLLRRYFTRLILDGKFNFEDSRKHIDEFKELLKNLEPPKKNLTQYEYSKEMERIVAQLVTTVQSRAQELIKDDKVEFRDLNLRLKDAIEASKTSFMISKEMQIKNDKIDSELEELKETKKQLNEQMEFVLKQQVEEGKKKVPQVFMVENPQTEEDINKAKAEETAVKTFNQYRQHGSVFSQDINFGTGTN